MKVLAYLLFFSLIFGNLFAQNIPQGYQAKGIVPVGYTDMDGKPAFKLSIKEHNGKWYLFTGQFWQPGWSVVDVTNPANKRAVLLPARLCTDNIRTHT